MLNRYRTGPLATVLVFALCLIQCVFGLLAVLHFHDSFGWVNALSSLLILSPFTERHDINRTCCL
jgi:hypothetical protein